MNLHVCLLKENDCYKAGKTMVPKGVMVHSTGANNPNLRRYVGPDDGLLGESSTRHWNQSGIGACVHAFIGRQKDGTGAGTVPADPRAVGTTPIFPLRSVRTTCQTSAIFRKSITRRWS